ncbi:MAG: hypothetical protein ABIH36_03525 [bacterium]
MLRCVKVQITRVTKTVWKLFPASHYVLLSALLVVGLELIFILQRWVVLIAVVAVTVVMLGVILVRFEERGRFGLIHSILPILAATGLAGYAFLLPTTQVLHLYILASGLIFFFLLKHGAREAYPIWNWTLSLVVYFLNVAFILGLRFHLYIPVLLVLVLVLAVTVLMGLQALRRVVRTASEIVLPALTMAFVLTEVVWVLQFLPSHYLVQAGVVTILYYVIFNLISLSYTRGLKRRDIVEYIGIGVVAFLLILISTRWV